VISERCRLHVDQTAATENRTKPNFLFSGNAAYNVPASDVRQLTVPGMKSTFKDWWKQVLPEADRILRKYLIALETGISRQQTTKIQEKKRMLPLHRPAVAL